jgi:hypothetical protein
LDDDPDRATRARNEATRHLDRLRRLVEATHDAVDEAQPVFAGLLEDGEVTVTRDDLMAATARFADELGLTPEEREIVITRIDACDLTHVRQSVDQLPAQGLGAIGELLQRMYDETATEFAEREYLS